MSAEEQLREIERQVWETRQHAFNTEYRTYFTPTLEGPTGWAALATLDHVLSLFRGVIDGTPGSGAEQTAAQQRRVQTEEDGR